MHLKCISFTGFSVFSRRRQLPSIEEAWNLPISAEMSSRQQQQQHQNSSIVQQRTSGPAFQKGYTQVTKGSYGSNNIVCCAMKKEAWSIERVQK
jgi:hypothetical protein